MLYRSSPLWPHLLPSKFLARIVRSMSQAVAVAPAAEEPAELVAVSAAVPPSRKRFPSPEVAPPPRKKRGKASADIVDLDAIRHIDYYFDKGLRKVAPYYFTFNSHAKQRWLGRTLGEIFTSEFFAINEEVVRARVNAEPSTLFANGSRVDKNYRVKNGDFIAHYMHRHEMPVSAQPIKIVAETEDLLVIDKPASMPVHPCGRFRMNSVMYILAKEQGRNNLRLINRLDRLTSGLLLLAKTTDAANNLHDQMRGRNMHKTYVARVVGQFPAEPVLCEDAIETVNRRAGINQVIPDSTRFCSTQFRRLSYDPVASTSIVQCEPLTGRTHQIRVHLQHLGHPIVNDPIYGPDAPNLAHYIPDDPATAGKTRAARDASGGRFLSSSGEGSAEADEEVWALKGLKFAQRTTLPAEPWADAECPECWVEFVDPRPEQLGIDLHAWKYGGLGWAYETELPGWARAGTEGATEAGKDAGEGS